MIPAVPLYPKSIFSSYEFTRFLSVALLFATVLKSTNGLISFKYGAETQWVERNYGRSDDLRWADKAYSFLQSLDCSYFSFTMLS
ncbi:hypothetical protein RRG08_048316, partial [Elysia crispata]